MRLALALTLIALCVACGSSGEERPPNLVLILADDLGWMDVGYNGSSLCETPHLDALAERGTVFTNAYAASPVCSPTRASILLGKHPARVQLTSALSTEHLRSDRPPGPVETGPPDAAFWGPVIRNHVPETEQTMAELLRESGYVTGFVGKWHLGRVLPPSHGFDFAVAADSLGVPDSYFSPYGLNNLEDADGDEYLTDRLTDEAIAFIDRAGDRPFFLYLSHFAPHFPWEAWSHHVRRFEERVDPEGPQRNATYAAMIYAMDLGIGRIVAALEERGLSDRTVIVFTSDNGGHTTRTIRKSYDYHITSNEPLRSGKGRLYEGGVRVPLVLFHPRLGNGTTRDEPVVSMDLLPTFLALAGRDPSAVPDLDGEDLAPLLRGETRARPRSIFFHMPHQTMASAVRRGHYKLIHYFNGKDELYDLDTDLGETRNLAPRRPKIVAALGEELLAWQESVGAVMPTPNPAFERRQ